jgi:acetyl-CoA acetyltransferase
VNGPLSPDRTPVIVGVGNTEQGELPGLSADLISVQAIENALADAGLDKRDVNGLVTCKPLGTEEGTDERIAQLLGINPDFGSTLHYGTANFSANLAALAISSGLAHTLILAYGTNQRSRGVTFGRNVGRSGGELATRAGFVHVAGPAAMAFRRYQHMYGTTEQELASISVAQRVWARMNPLAIFQDPLSVEEYLATPYLVEPLRRHDLTMISDGGAALVMTTASRAADYATRPVYVRALAEGTGLRGMQNDGYFERSWIADISTRLWANARLKPSDMDLLYIQDPTSVWVLQMLEMFGFCQPGEGCAFIESGATLPGGSLPLNTNGGQLSESYMWGWLHLCEAVRQLRGECGQRQVPDPKHALCCSSHDFLKGAALVLATVGGLDGG